MNVRTNRVGRRKEGIIKLLEEKKSGADKAITARLAKKKPSPIRFIRRVNSPEEIELEF